MQSMKEEHERYVEETTKREQTLVKEKNALQSDFDQLAASSMADRKVLESFITRTNQQDALIKQQQESITAKVCCVQFKLKYKSYCIAFRIKE